MKPVWEMILIFTTGVAVGAFAVFVVCSFTMERLVAKIAELRMKNKMLVNKVIEERDENQRLFRENVRLSNKLFYQRSFKRVANQRFGEGEEVEE